MSILSRVSTGTLQAGQRIVLAGAEKIGKTTLACQAPNPLLVPMEMGFGAMSVPKTPMLSTWEEVVGLCEELRSGAMQGKITRGSSIIWDSGTALERIIHAKCLTLDGAWKPNNPNGLTMESALGGYGKAYNMANELFAKWVGYADELAFHAGINTIVTCHVFAARVIDPAHGEFDTWDLLLHSPKNQKNYGKREFITQWADLVGYLHEPLFVIKGDKGQLQQAVSSNQGRQLAVDRKPTWVAGNRYGMSGLIPIPQKGGWNYLADAIFKSCGIDLYNRSLT